MLSWQCCRVVHEHWRQQQVQLPLQLLPGHHGRLALQRHLTRKFRVLDVRRQHAGVGVQFSALRPVTYIHTCHTCIYQVQKARASHSLI
jgi:hypothetical protein